MTVMIAGRSSGRITRRNSVVGEAPSMIAASSSSRGMADTKVRKMSTENGIRNATSTSTRPGMVLNRPTACST